jgi:hypothetical protein
MQRVLHTRGVFAALCLLGSPALVFAVVWALDGLGVRMDQLSTPVYVAVLAGLPAVLVVTIGRIAHRRDLEIMAALIVSIGTTFFLAFLLVAYGLSHADLN